MITMMFRGCELLRVGFESLRMLLLLILTEVANLSLTSTSMLGLGGLAMIQTSSLRTGLLENGEI